MSKNNSKARKHLELLYGELYEFKHNGDRLSCYYCGMPRYCLDHVPPISLVGKIGTKKLKELEIEFYKVPCCDFCNSALGSVRLISEEERLVFLYNHINKKIEKQALWSSSEIEELTGNLRNMIAGRQNRIRNELITRLKAIEKRIAEIENT